MFFHEMTYANCVKRYFMKVVENHCVGITNFRSPYEHLNLALYEDFNGISPYVLYVIHS